MNRRKVALKINDLCIRRFMAPTHVHFFHVHFLEVRPPHGRYGVFPPASRAWRRSRPNRVAATSQKGVTMTRVTTPTAPPAFCARCSFSIFEAEVFGRE